MCLAQGHNAVPPVRLEPATTRSRVKHLTTESHCIKPNIFANSPNIICIICVRHLGLTFSALYSLSSLLNAENLEFCIYANISIKYCLNQNR